MSFIDMMANDVWSEADIVNRTEAMIRSGYPPNVEAIINRKATGAALGQYVLSADEQAEIAAYSATSEAARQAGNAARADMALLRKVLDHEAAQRRLALPAVTEPATATGTDENGEAIEVANPAIAQDEAERAAAQAVIDAADQATLDLVTLRNPPESGA